MREDFQNKFVGHESRLLKKLMGHEIHSGGFHGKLMPVMKVDW